MRTHGILSYVMDHALEEAIMLRREAAQDRQNATEKDRIATALEELHGIAEALLGPSVAMTSTAPVLSLDGNEEAAA